MRKPLMLALTAMALGSFVSPTRVAGQSGFPHEKHSVFFSDCSACHSGVTSGTDADVYPQLSTCTACHDGNTAPAIDWQTPEARWSSLDFPHGPHEFECGTCHLPGGGEDLSALAYPEPELCLTCHAPGTRHELAECGFCHAEVKTLERLSDRSTEGFHGAGFVNNHAAAASAGQPDCASCHAENTCIQCHDGQDSNDFHPLNFLASHGPEAYGRVSDCTSCHTSEGFCRECHLNVGMEGGGGFVAPFHDNQALWLLSHPQAARQDLESCVTCHQQNSCLRCHSASSGLRINPHGPGFDGSSIAEKNPAMCTACHIGGSS